jgi:hypothetical protein
MERDKGISKRLFAFAVWMNIQEKRNERNNSEESLSSVLPHELVRMSIAVVENTIVNKHLQQL